MVEETMITLQKFFSYVSAKIYILIKNYTSFFVFFYETLYLDRKSLMPHSVISVQSKQSSVFSSKEEFILHKQNIWQYYTKKKDGRFRATCNFCALVYAYTDIWKFTKHLKFYCRKHAYNINLRSKSWNKCTSQNKV